MKPTTTIRLLTTTTNEQGDLFTRLMDDLFAALGYEQLRHDIAKPGRELDVHGTHYLEPRQMRAECKAHNKKIGGDEVCKFRGALLAEQIEAGKQKIVGYFVSLGGFRQSAIEQEARLGRKGIVLIDAPEIIKHLERSRAVMTDAEAIDQASRCAQLAGLHDIVADDIELLGHEMGYLKAVYYAHNKQRTHFALISASDGVPLAETMAKDVIKADTECGGGLSALRYLAPNAAALGYQELQEQALAFYRAWVGRECGFIQLDGLPIDGKLDKRLELEKLFVPLKIKVFESPSKVRSVGANEYHPNTPKYTTKYQPDTTRALDIGEVLDSAKHLALLASPGSGKSTLLKRLATAYAFAERRTEIDDKLPKRQWLPLFLRCRNLREHTAKSVLQLLEELPKRLNMPPEMAEGFGQAIHKELTRGNVLLLVDGLDEIWDESSRKQFALHLQSFMEAYPAVKLVITSREAGFRVVAGIMAEICYQARIEPLDNKGIAYLCQQWHAEVYGESVEVREEATKLIAEISSNASVLSLAHNPLLLTTLLVVKRSIGELPTNRAALYAAAVQLLVRTWNIEGFNALNERETFAQLCYVACAMTERGVKQITHSALVDLLQDAREELAAELQYSRLSPEEFILQVEHRSSLLMMIGYKQVRKEMQPLYEFRHLTFQEFLAARGYVRNLHPRRRKKLSLVQLLEPHFLDDSWHEVIRLAAVLAEIEAEPLIELLNEQCDELTLEDLEFGNGQNVELLAKCVMDEVTVHPKILRESLKQLGRFGENGWMGQYALMFILEGNIGPLLVKTVEEEFFSAKGRWEEYARAVKNLCYRTVGYEISYTEYMHKNATQLAEIKAIENMLTHGTREERVKAALDFVTEVHNWYMGQDLAGPIEEQEWLPAEQRAHLTSLFRDMIASGDLPSIYAGAWALAIGLQGLRVLEQKIADPTLVELLLRAWYVAADIQLARHLALALINQPLLPRNALQQVNLDKVTFGAKLSSLLEFFYSGMLEATETKAIVLIAWYLRAPWNDVELMHIIDQTYRVSRRTSPESASSWLVGQIHRAGHLFGGLESDDLDLRAFFKEMEEYYKSFVRIVKPKVANTIPVADSNDATIFIDKRHDTGLPF